MAMNHLPFPSNEHVAASASRQLVKPPEEHELPWKRIGPSEPPLNMLGLQLANGNVISFAYADLRETRLLSAGYLQLLIHGMEKTLVTIEGRNLTELANLVGMGRIKSMVELGKRNFARPETSPAIDKISIETLTGPSPC